MHLGFAILANFADLQTNGTFSVSGGGIDGYVLDVLPTTIPTVTLVANIVFLPQECGKSYTLGLTFQGPGGQEQKLAVRQVLQPVVDPFFPERPENLNVIIPLSNWIIANTGLYFFRLYVTDLKLGEVSVGVALNPVMVENIKYGDI